MWTYCLYNHYTLLLNECFGLFGFHWQLLSGGKVLVNASRLSQLITCILCGHNEAMFVEGLYIVTLLFIPYLVMT